MNWEGMKEASRPCMIMELTWNFEFTSVILWCLTNSRVSAAAVQDWKSSWGGRGLKCCWHFTFSKSFNRSSFSLMLFSKACFSFSHSSCIFNDKLTSASKKKTKLSVYQDQRTICCACHNRGAIHFNTSGTYGSLTMKTKKKLTFGMQSVSGI